MLRRARRVGVSAGADPQRIPRDFGTLARFSDARAAVRAGYPMPDPLPLEWAGRLVGECGREHGVSRTEDWTGLPCACRPSRAPCGGR